MLRTVLPLVCLALLPAQNALACATCLCGDPTLTTMGVEKPFAGRTRLNIEYLARDESMGVPQQSELTIDEKRMTYSLSYAPNELWMFGLSLPMVTKNVQRFDTSEDQSSGAGDIDLSVRHVIGNDESFPKRQLWGVQVGVRLPTSTEQETNGQPIDFDAQVGAGATVASLGLWSGWYRSPWFFYTSATAQHYLEDGYQGYRAGDALLMTGQAQYALTYSLALQFGIDARWKGKDHYRDEADPNSGGFLAMAAPGIAWTPFTDTILHARMQVPVLENPNGKQEEGNVLYVGVTYDF